jgi:hypothetical protein
VCFHAFFTVDASAQKRIRVANELVSVHAPAGLTAQRLRWLNARRAVRWEPPCERAHCREHDGRGDQCDRTARFETIEQRCHEPCRPHTQYRPHHHTGPHEHRHPPEDEPHHAGRWGAERHADPDFGPPVQRLLVVGQIALTLVLLVGTGLLIRSLVHLFTGSFGFEPQGVVVVHTELPAQRRSPDGVRAAFSDLDDRLTAVPGVEAASVMVGSMPFTSNTDVGFWRADRPRPAVPGEWPTAMSSAVGPDYFRTMRIPLLRGVGLHRRTMCITRWSSSWTATWQ